MKKLDKQQMSLVMGGDSRSPDLPARQRAEIMENEAKKGTTQWLVQKEK
ncbi:hypothetical protein PRUB_b0787 [Pseudoalteromonas rubra]|uniref:Uncharacterized protein n=1 Tax=Pseudoalteromonas rubra TaxID=43658 RepID=A0A8T0C0P9_9GAMM|nr:hypothetical protein [Pseudoalteromonas rubra]KAF7781535.1 hypothetical protein PRUB_b0787 [Pseudoalteromonas rubra]